MPQLNWHYYVWVNAISVHALYIVIIVRRPKYVTQFMHYFRTGMYMYVAFVQVVPYLRIHIFQSENRYCTSVQIRLGKWHFTLFLSMHIGQITCIYHQTIYDKVICHITCTSPCTMYFVINIKCIVVVHNVSV